jgi:hypothetical protein
MSIGRIISFATALLVAGCTGYSFGPSRDTAAPARAPEVPAAVVNPEVLGVGPVGIRRLTRTEYIASVRDLLGKDVPEAYTFLPDDPGLPFHNDYRSQVASAGLIEALQQLAELMSDRLLADPAQRDLVVGCTPTGPDDVACLKSFVEKFGRKALRRALTDEDTATFLAFQADARELGDFYVGVKLVLRAMLQHPEFLYRIEFGTEVPERAGLFRLNNFELATRLSFFLLGATPNDELLDLAAAGKLSTPSQVRDAAASILANPRARAVIHSFHAQWLGYTQPKAPTASLQQAMQTETKALVDRVVFERQEPWLNLFRSTETFANDELAGHYGLTLPGSATPSWVSYGTSGRKGILSHAGFLTNGIKFGDTSPTQRGKFIRNRLMCQEVPKPPPDVPADQPPSSDTGPCKVDRYRVHSQSGVCSSCHSLMDPLGFGLENYDAEGRFRTTEPDAPECVISGEGEMAGVGTFNGPGELGELLIQSGQLEPCLVKQLFSSAWGRQPTADDAAYVDAVTTEFKSDGRFDQLILDFVSNEAFGYRREEVSP